MSDFWEFLIIQKFVEFHLIAAVAGSPTLNPAAAVRPAISTDPPCPLGCFSARSSPWPSSSTRNSATGRTARPRTSATRLAWRANTVCAAESTTRCTRTHVGLTGCVSLVLTQRTCGASRARIVSGRRRSVYGCVLVSVESFVPSLVMS